jgi:two-component system, sensor histidine kinase LadS
LASASFLAHYALNIGSVLELSFLTLGLADTIRAERREQKQLAQQRAADIEAAEWRTLSTERERMTTEMHDGLGNTLLTLRQLVRAAPPGAADSTWLHQFEWLVGEAYDKIRKVVNNLLPGEFAQKGLYVALQELVDTLNQAQPPQVFLLLPTQPLPLPIGHQYQLYLVMNELMNNVIKHANATEASIRFTTMPDCLLVSVRDNGVGLPNVPSLPAGHGLANSQRRLKTLGGSIAIDSAPASAIEPGTRLTIQIPLTQAGRI